MIYCVYICFVKFIGVITIKIIICDDQKDYVEDIKNHVELFMREHSINATFKESLSGTEIINNPEFYDIAFLDIEMGETNGIEVGRALKKVNENIIIFIITAYDKYLDDALDLNVLRFLSKPLNPRRLYNGLEKALKIIDNTIIELCLENPGSVEKIPINNIIYVEIVNRKVKVVTKNGVFYSKNNIRFFQECLIASFFYQTHKSYIVNLKFVTKYDYDMLTITNGDKVPVSFRKRGVFHQYFLGYFNGK